MSTAGLPPPWSAAQQAWLQAMGYTVFVDGQLEETAPVAEVTLSVAAAPAAPPPSRTAAGPVEAGARSAAPPPRRAAPVSADAPPNPATAPRERASGSRRPAVRMPDRLQISLLRALGRNPADPDTQAVMAGWNLDTLRGNAAAKRALWPQLRALRRQGKS